MDSFLIVAKGIALFRVHLREIDHVVCVISFGISLMNY